MSVDLNETSVIDIEPFVLVGMVIGFIGFQ